MQNSRSIALFAFLILAAALCAAQARPAAAMPTTPAAPPSVTASSLLQPSVDVVVNTLNGLNIDKWKKGSVRQEAGDHVNSILRDIQTNLPPLIAAADASPASVSTAMPLIKHLDALYDVLLRVEEASRVSAPGDQISQLQQALTAFSTARFAYDDTLQKQAATQEQQLTEMRVSLVKASANAATEKKAAEAKPCVPAKPLHRRRRTSTKKVPEHKPAQQTSQKPH